ncbi:hypothetical protein JYQ62_18375 [Nostoc sp. UHCC 0702]|nr:hypothetical protein JYQ62_18375 [Nostoc sp. UHCC 0702]
MKSKLFVNNLITQLDFLKISEIVDLARSNAYAYLSSFRNDAGYIENLETAFGTGFDREAANQLFDAFAVEDFSNIPSIEIINGNDINNANGAFSITTGKIYLAAEFVSQNAQNLDAIVAVLLEETGHYIDTQINLVDAAGDEGDVFARLVQGKSVSQSELAVLQAEDDKATVTVDNQVIEIEQNTSSVQIFQHINYGGNSVSLAPGNYDFNQLGVVGNDNLSSLKIPTGLSVRLYENSGFQGKYKDFYGEISFVGDDFNDLTSSIQVIPYVEIFQDRDYKGNSFRLTPGNYNFDQLGSVGNDNLSSLKIPTGLSVRIYEHGGFQGKYKDFNNGEIYFVDDDFNDLTSSVQIKRIEQGNNPQATSQFKTINRPTTEVKAIIDDGSNQEDILQLQSYKTTEAGLVQKVWGYGGADIFNVAFEPAGDGRVGIDFNAGNLKKLAQMLVEPDWDVRDRRIKIDKVNAYGQFALGVVGGASEGMLSSIPVLGGFFSAATNVATATAQLSIELATIDAHARLDIEEYNNDLQGIDDFFADQNNSDWGSVQILDTRTVVEIRDFEPGVDTIILPQLPENWTWGIGSGVFGDTSKNYVSLSFENGSNVSREILRIGFNDKLSSQINNKEKLILDLLIKSTSGSATTSKPGWIIGKTIKEPQSQIGPTVIGTIANDALYISETNTHSLVTLSGGLGDDLLAGRVNGNDELHGGEGNDYIAPGGGSDIINGGAGYDRVDYSNLTTGINKKSSAFISIEDKSFPEFTSIEGIIGTRLDDTIDFSSLTVTDSDYKITGLISLSGNDGDDTLKGSKYNDLIDGGAGVDDLTGGDGDDIYIVDNDSDTITENANEGTDTIESSVTFSLAYLPNIENLTLTGTATINGSGNAGNNVIIGNSADNTLIGLEGNDTLNGGAGYDWLIGGQGNDTLNGGAGYDDLYGGAGNDTYIVDSTTDSIIENANEGTDTIESSVSFSLANLSNIENLTLTGTAAINGTGNAGNNVIIGNSANNALLGGAGYDDLRGGAGNDNLNGGEGDDSLNGDEGIDNLYGGEGNDNLYGGAGNDNLYGGAGNDTYILDGTTDTINENANEGTDTIKSSVSFTLAYLPNIENLTLTGTAAINGTGNAGNNVIIGNSANNALLGGAGYDNLFAGAGNDNLYGEVGNDWLDGDEGNDTLNGGAENDWLDGGAGDDSLNGDEGIDWLNGGEGNDTLNGGEGDDALLAGGAGDDTLNGGAGNDWLSGDEGNDTLNGGAGYDDLYGGAGNDTYIVDSTTDIIIESAYEGTDTIESSVTFSLANLPNIENLTLTGTAAINGTGNAGNNVIIGNSANNTLNGGAGSDALNGGDGDDRLYGDVVDNVGSTSFKYNGKTYLLTSVGTWEQAQAQAQSLGGNLVTINDQAEQDWLVTTFGNTERLWIGLTDKQTEGTFKWVSGEPFTPFTYNNWSPGEPNNVGDEDYVEMYSGGKWNDMPGSFTSRGIVEINYEADFNDTLNGGAGNDTLNGSLGKDILTGGMGADRFDYRNLGDSLLSNFDVITDFNANVGNDLFLVSTARTGFSDRGAVATLDTTSIASKLTTANFGANSAAQFSFGSRTFVAINDATAGFNAQTDAIIELTGLTGTLGTSNFVV